MCERGASLVDRLVLQSRIAKLREYLEIDRHRVYRALSKDLGDFERFIKAVSRLL